MARRPYDENAEAPGAPARGGQEEPQTAAPAHPNAPMSNEDRYQAFAEHLAEQFDEADFETPDADYAKAISDHRQVQASVAKTEREYLIQEARNQKRQREEFMAAAHDRRLPRAVTTSPFDAFPSDAIPMDEDGEPAGTAGFHKRRVRLVDHDRRETNGRVGEMAKWGYRPVKSRVTGKVITDRFGMLMECSPEGEGRRRAYYGRRTVSEDVADREKELHAVIDGVNREFGMEAMRPFKDQSRHTAGR